jgi:hypothetical protein
MLAELVGRVLDPVTARRGFGTADLIAAWPEIVGARFAEFTRPERIAWPRGGDERSAPGMLVLRAEGPRAVLVQHEVGQIVEKVNGFLGYAAVDRVRIVQAPMGAPGGPVAAAAAEALPPDAEARLGAAIADVDDDGLRHALDRLGRGVLSRR